MLKLLPVIPPAPFQFSKMTQSPSINRTLLVPAGLPPASTSHSPIQKSNWRYSGFERQGLTGGCVFECDVDGCDCAKMLSAPPSVISEMARILSGRRQGMIFISSENQPRRNEEHEERTEGIDVSPFLRVDFHSFSRVAHCDMNDSFENRKVRKSRALLSPKRNES